MSRGVARAALARQWILSVPKIALMLYQDFAAMSLAATAAFEMVNLRRGSPYYDITMVSQNGGMVRSSLGADVASSPFSEFDGDTLIIAGADRLQTFDQSFLEELQHRSSDFRRVASMCTGAFALAEAGLLDGRRATTHWNYAAQFRSRYPQVRTEEDRIFTTDGPFWTSAGMSAGTDMALAMVEDDLGSDLAKEIARILVMYNRRSGGQLQFSALLELDAKSDRIQNAVNFARANLATALSVEDLARVANLSTRQFSRAFKGETGQSPAKAIERMRAEAARQMLEEGRHPIDMIARETGFNDRDRMRKAFIDLFGHPPQAVRRAIRSERAI